MGVVSGCFSGSFRFLAVFSDMDRFSDGVWGVYFWVWSHSLRDIVRGSIFMLLKLRCLACMFCIFLSLMPISCLFRSCADSPGGASPINDYEKREGMATVD